MNLERPITHAGDVAVLRGMLHRSRLAALCLSAAMLAACGSGGGSSDSDSAAAAVSSSISGTVATGSPAANVTVTAYEPAGASCGTATTAADGTYTLNGTCTPPYLLSAQTAAGLLVAPVMSGQTSGSITPITTGIFRVATGNTASNVSATSLAASLASLTPTQLSTTQASIVGALAALFPGYTWSGFDPYASFTANHAGIDGVIDQLGMQPAPGGMVTFTNTAAGQAVTVTANGGDAPTVGPVTPASGSAGSGTGSTGTGTGSTGSGTGSSGDGSTGSGSSGDGSSGTGSGSTGTGSSGTGSGSSGSGTTPVLHCAP